MNLSKYSSCKSFLKLSCSVIGLVAVGCGPSNASFQTYRAEGLAQLQAGQHAAAKGSLEAAYMMVPENAENLCDLASCHIGIAKTYFERDDQRAALRELDRAINYYDRAIRSFPGYAIALQGKNDALEMRGQYRKALEIAIWASQQVGPSVEQQIFLAKEYAERGDADQALLAYKQAVAMDPSDAMARWELGFYLIELDRADEGIPQLQEAYRLDPSKTFVAAELKRLGAEVPVVDHQTSSNASSAQRSPE